MWKPRRTQIENALMHAQKLFNASAKADHPSGFELDASLLPTRSIVHKKGNILIIEEDFVTMAISLADLVEIDGLVAASGIDDQGQRGFLVMREKGLPFHSIDSTGVLCPEALSIPFSDRHTSHLE